MIIMQSYPGLNNEKLYNKPKMTVVLQNYSNSSKIYYAMVKRYANVTMLIIKQII